MRIAPWLLLVLAIGAIARAEPTTGTVVVSCNEADAALIVDNVLLPERTPAVLTLPSGTHVIEVRKPPLHAEKQVIQVLDQQQIKVRFELLPPAPPPSLPGTGSDAGSAAGSASGAAAGSAAPPPTTATPPGSGSAAPAVVPAVQHVGPTASRCTEGGHEVACVQGPHCTEGGKPVPCKKGEALPPALAPPPGPPVQAAASTMPGAGSNAIAEPPRTAPTVAAVEIATTAPHAIAYVDGAPIREAPCVLEVEPGEHVIAVYATGMVPAEALVRVATGQRQRVELTPSTPRRRIDVPAQ